MRPIATIAIVVLAHTACLAQQDAGLVARYTFDELDGRILPDVSGGGLDGVVNGATLVESPQGHALRVTHQNNLRFKWGDEGEYDHIELPADFLDGECYHIAELFEHAHRFGREFLGG